MLRGLIALCGCALLVAGIVTLAVPPHGGFPLLIFGGIVLLSVFFEGRYRSGAAAQKRAWQPTGEKFIDPGTGRLVEVEYDPQSGERNYRQT